MTINVKALIFLFLRFILSLVALFLFYKLQKTAGIMTQTHFVEHNFSEAYRTATSNEIQQLQDDQVHEICK